MHMKRANPKKKSRSSMKRVLSREFLGHHAEHEAKHRLKEKVSFAVLEHGLLLGEGFVSRVADDLRLRKLAAAPPPPSPMRDAVAGLFRRARGGNASAGLLQAQPRCGDCSALENAAHARWSWDVLSTAQRRAALEVASDDERLYRLALPRAAKEWPGRPSPRGSSASPAGGSRRRRRRCTPSRGQP